MALLGRVPQNGIFLATGIMAGVPVGINVNLVVDVGLDELLVLQVFRGYIADISCL